MDREEDSGDGASAQLSKGAQLRAKLMVVVTYAQRGLVPALAVAALLLALVALNNPRVEPVQFSALGNRFETLNNNLGEIRNELEVLKLTLAHERAQRGEDRKKQEDQEAMIVQSVTRIQVKLKMFPTLEEQLSATSAPAAAPVDPASPIYDTPRPLPKPQAGSISAAPPTMPAAKAAVPTTKSSSTGKPESVASKPAVKNQAEIQAEALKAAIENFNRH